MAIVKHVLIKFKIFEKFNKICQRCKELRVIPSFSKNLNQR